MKKNLNKPILIISLKRRHLLIILILLLMFIFGYSFYFREFMTLPQQAINTLGETPISSVDKKIMVLAPHCDDETLGAGGLIYRAKNEGSGVRVYIVTDCNKHKIGPTRKKESIAALATLKVPLTDINFLSYAEGKDNRPEEEKIDLYDELKWEVNEYKPDIIVAPHPRDTHQDHKFVGEAIEKIVIENNLKDHTIYYLIHFNFLKYPSPSGLKPDKYLLPPAKLISFTDRWYKFMLSEEEEDIKEEAVLQYKSQLKLTNPVLYRVLLDFVRRNELFMMESVVNGY